MLGRIIILAALPVMAVTLSGCVETQAATDSMSSKMMARAQRLSASEVTPAEISSAFAEGEGLKTIKDQPVGKKFSLACTRLYKSTESSAGFNALDSSDSITLAKCAGFRS